MSTLFIAVIVFAFAALAVFLWVKGRFGSSEELNEFVTVYLRNVECVEKTQMAIVLNEA